MLAQDDVLFYPEFIGQPPDHLWVPKEMMKANARGDKLCYYSIYDMRNIKNGVHINYLVAQHWNISHIEAFLKFYNNSSYSLQKGTTSEKIAREYCFNYGLNYGSPSSSSWKRQPASYLVGSDFDGLFTYFRHLYK